MGDVIALRNWMCADDNGYVEFRLDEITEVVNVWAWRITNHHACREMNGFNAIFLHFLYTILNVATGTTPAGGIPYKFYFLVLVYAEGSFSIPQGPKTFSSGTIMVAITDNYTHFFLGSRHVNHTEHITISFHLSFTSSVRFGAFFIAKHDVSARASLLQDGWRSFEKYCEKEKRFKYF